MAIEIRLIRENEIQQANDFFNSIYKTNRSLKNFRWEFIEGPFGPAIYVVAIDADSAKIIGTQCAIPIELINSKGEKILTAKSEDTLVDPAYRGQKIFEKMYDVLFTECSKAGIKYIWGFTPAVKAFERIGFQIPFQAHQALFVFNPFKSYNYLSRLNASNKSGDKIKIGMLSLLAWVKSFLVFFPSVKRYSFKAIPTQEDKNDCFKDFYSGKDYYTLHETSTYLTWRLVNNPFNNQYINYRFISNNQPAGDAIINIRKDVSYIEQLMIKDGSNIPSIVKTLVKQIRKYRLPMIRVLCFDTNDELRYQSHSLKSTGFTYLKRGMFFVWKPLDETSSIRPEQVLLNRLYTQGNL